MTQFKFSVETDDISIALTGIEIAIKALETSPEFEAVDKELIRTSEYTSKAREYLGYCIANIKQYRETQEPT